MGITTTFVYDHIDQVLHYSSIYSDLLNIYGNEYEYEIGYDGTQFTLTFKIYGGKNNQGDSRGTRYLPESGGENSQDSI